MAGNDDEIEMAWRELRMQEADRDIEPAVPVAFRAYFADLDWDGFYRHVRSFSAMQRWWLMAKRLEAYERLGTDDLVATVRPSYVEWRVRVA